jgi:predicted dehydrogenase
MKIGLIGTNWGRIHCGTFKKWGYSIDTIMGTDLEKTRRIATEEGIPRFTADAADLRDMDVIVIASPHETHARYIDMFRDKWILCEKPLTGSAASAEEVLACAPEHLYVNYAFPFLETAGVIRSAVAGGTVGEIHHISLNIAVSFPFDYSDKEWFVSVASHELYFLNHLFGSFTMHSFYSEIGMLNVAMILTNGRQVLSLNLHRAHRESLMLDLAMSGDSGELLVRGGYLPGRNWNFDPVTVNGERINGGEYSQSEDIWLRANALCVKSFLSVYNGTITRENARDAGLADLSNALLVEKGLSGFLPQR